MSGGWEESSRMQDELNRRIDNQRERERMTPAEEAGGRNRIRVYRKPTQAINA